MIDTFEFGQVSKAGGNADYSLNYARGGGWGGV